jgi:alpha-tubulin suppressor-like RCC1 family protein
MAPQNASTGVAVNKVVNISFDEPVDPSSINDSSVTVIGPDNNPIDGLLFVNGATVLFVPDAVFTGSKVYTVKVSGVRDLAGNAMDGMATSAFTTGTNASDPPSVISTIPRGNTQDVAINSSIIATFNKPLNCATVKDFTVGTGSEVISGTLSCSGNTVTFTPSSQLSYGATYTASIKGVADSGNNYAMNGAYTWSFKTGFMPDTTGPEIISTTPSTGATGVSLSSGINVKFSENMDCSSVSAGTFTLTNAGGSVSGTVSCSNDTAVFTPSSKLSSNTVYTAKVTGGANGVKDTSGNSLLNDYSWSFTTKLVSNITEMSGGIFHSVALKGDKTVIAWGGNMYGQLGTGDGLDTVVPVSVGGLSDVVSVSAGDYHAVALKGDGTVWTWGNNTYGQIGDGSTTRANTPVQVLGLSGITGIAAGGSATYAVKTDGTVWAWGNNEHGQIGNGSSGVGNYVASPIQVAGLNNVTKVSAGGAHVLALKSDGTVWAWGSGQYGQVGNGTSGAGNDVTLPVQVSGLTGVSSISAGRWSHSLAVKSDGTVWTWGANSYGQLGNGSVSDSSVPVQVSGLSNVTAATGGEFHSLAVKSDGTVWAWGANTYGQIGDGTPLTRRTPVQVVIVGGTFTADVIGAGYRHSLAAKSDGTAWAWGINANGQLGTGDSMSYANPTEVSF